MFCVSLDPVSNSLAVTGGEDDRAFVWSVSDGGVLFECTGLQKRQQVVYTLGVHQHKPASL